MDDLTVKMHQLKNCKVLLQNLETQNLENSKSRQLKISTTQNLEKLKISKTQNLESAKSRKTQNLEKLKISKT